jgi:hypothetical protein
MQKIYRKALKNYVYELHKKFRIRLKDAKELAPEDARGKEGKLLPFGRSPQLAYAVLASGCSPAGRRLPAAISHRLANVVKCICGLSSPFHQFGLLVQVASA